MLFAFILLQYTFHSKESNATYSLENTKEMDNEESREGTKKTNKIDYERQYDLERRKKTHKFMCSMKNTVTYSQIKYLGLLLQREYFLNFNYEKLYFIFYNYSATRKLPKKIIIDDEKMSEEILLNFSISIQVLMDAEYSTIFYEINEFEDLYFCSSNKNRINNLKSLCKTQRVFAELNCFINNLHIMHNLEYKTIEKITNENILMYLRSNNSLYFKTFLQEIYSFIHYFEQNIHKKSLTPYKITKIYYLIKIMYVRGILQYKYLLNEMKTKPYMTDLIPDFWKNKFYVLESVKQRTILCFILKILDETDKEIALKNINTIIIFNFARKEPFKIPKYNILLDMKLLIAFFQINDLIIAYIAKKCGLFIKPLEDLVDVFNSNNILQTEVFYQSSYYIDLMIRKVAEFYEQFGIFYNPNLEYLNVYNEIHIKNLSHLYMQYLIIYPVQFFKINNLYLCGVNSANTRFHCIIGKIISLRNKFFKE